MGDVLRRRFWVVNLIVIGAVAGLGAHAVRQALEAGFVPEPIPARLAAGRAAAPARADAKAGRGMLAHNIFCSTCAPLEPDGDPGGEGEAREAQSHLPVTLVGTLVTPEAIRSVAVIRDRGAAPSPEADGARLFPVAAYRPGDRVAGYPAVVERVDARRVYLRVNGRLEYVDLLAPSPARKEPGRGYSRGRGADPRRAPRGAI